MRGYSRRRALTISGAFVPLPIAGCTELLGEAELTSERATMVETYEDGFQRYRQGNHCIELGRKKFDDSKYDQAHELFAISKDEFNGSLEKLSEISDTVRAERSQKARSSVTEAIEKAEASLRSVRSFADLTRTIAEAGGQEDALTRFNEAYYEYDRSDSEIATPGEFESAIREGS